MRARRDFLRQLVPAGVLGAVALNTDWLERIVSAGAAVADRSAAEVAADEGYWRDIQQAFTLDRTIINLNNGYTCPSPRVVHEALKRYLDSSNQAPIHFMWNTLEPNVEQVRRKLAVEVGCDMEELAITRNASEGLQIVQLGIDLKPGDHVVTTNQDYGRMLDTWDQRVRRDKIEVTKIAFPVPTTNISELTDRITRAITPKTKVIHICHITNLTGQLFPVRDIARMARARGIQTIVDGAHAFAHFPFKVSDLECDYYGCSLHKWMLAPVGTGFLYVRQGLAADAGGREQVGQHPQVRGDRHAPGREPQRNRGSARLPPGDRHRAQGGPAALPERSLGEQGGQAARREDPQQPRAQPGLGAVQRQPRARRVAQGVRVPVVEVPHHHRRDQARRLPGAAGHAERLHHARGSGHVRDGDRGSPEERRAVNGRVGTGD